LKGNDPVLLDSQTAWIVEHGIVALFSVPLLNGVPRGPRRFLCRLEAGETVFAGLSGSAAIGIAAIAIEETRVQVLPAANLINSAVERNPSAIRSIESWVRKAATILNPSQDRAVREAQARQREASRIDSPYSSSLLEPGQIFHPEADEVVVVELKHGQVRLFDRQEHTLDESRSPLAMSPGMWFKAVSEVEFSQVPLSRISSPVVLRAALSRLDEIFFQTIHTGEQNREQADQKRLHKKHVAGKEIRAHAFSELASVLKPSSGPRSDWESTPLLAAMRAVAEARNLRVHAPAEYDPRVDPVQAIAQASGFRTRRVLLSGNWWTTENGPLLGFTNEGNHPIAILPSKRKWFQSSRYEIVNPTEGTLKTVGPEVLSQLSPAALTFYRPLPQALNAFDLLKFGLLGHVRDLVVVVLTGVGATVLGMLTPQATAVLVEYAIPDANRAMVLEIGLGLMAAAIGSLFFQLAQSTAVLRLETASSSVLQCGVWDHLLKLTPGFFRKFSSGDLSARADAVNRIREQLSGATLRSIFVGFTALLNLILMFYYSATLALATVGLAVLAILLTSWSGAVVARLTRVLQEKEGRLFGTLVQLINAVPKLRVAGAEERAFAFWGHAYSQQQKIAFGIQQAEDRVRLLNTMLPTISSAVIFAVVVEFLIVSQPGQTNFVLGTFLAFNAAFGAFLAGSMALSDTAINLVGVATLWKRAEVILDAEPEVDPTKSHPGKLTGRISMDHVTFRYRNAGPLTLEDMTFEAGPGECIAIVGPSGSGKSTILNLLLRFEIPLSGAIYYDGQDLNSLDVNAVRRQIGVVLQENKIMAGSIFENIISGGNFTIQDAWDAARAAALAEDIEKMPMGMHTPLGEGAGTISGGQRQRLLIARALVSKPGILIFDEATSALDNRTQAIVTESLRRLRVTSVIVAHRLSTIRHANRVYVIAAGRVVQQGTFDELARQDGHFARLMARQML